ncbi:type 2 lantibiotic biosynthesis protein LanM [Streptomyces sp. cf124]|uniref:type 2 lanthipeptide synthetase LanM n=1 Tax=Streptomyces sp. cf124 TaxID=1761903 RepID=UPI0008E3E4E9|nr:type 2 lanthipeptide synthetase LanM [Streptomyces sp. cf124]SFN93946.1 type 2 lantibiotic biosynthesis protein LanM [Streptomyces sp. cf124]
MISPAEYYPEFNSVEFEETITPLAQFDGEVTAVLRDSRAGAASRTPDPGGRTDGVGTVEEWLRGSEQYPFQRVVRTVAAALAETDPLASFADLFADQRAALVQLLDRAEARLREVYTRPLVAAINHARENGCLQGATPGERYEYFVEQSGRTSFTTGSDLSFPVLQDVTRIILRNETDSIRELCTRLGADRTAIRDTFGIDTTDQLVSFGLSEGDTHHHGRAVSVLAFRSGKRLVYKPRDVSCEAAYVTIAGELNARLGTGLVSATVLERDRYGYVEYIDAEDVSDISAEFLHASGELAAVLYMLNARDMHFENILPTRCGPLPIDLETILHPERVHAGPIPEATGNAYTSIAQSIYGIGILPLVVAGKGDDAGHVDLGFLGDQGRGNSPFKSMQFEDPYTDHISLTFQTAAAAKRRTVVNALTEDEVHDLGQHMADGFTKVYRAVMADPDSWTALLHKTATNLRIRYVHNATALYAQTLRMTSSSSALEDTAPYLALLKRIAIASPTSGRQIVRSEIRQLAERDIPYFTVASTDTALTDGEGTAIGATFDRSPLDLALTKVEHVSEFDLGEQLRLIHSAFASRFPDNHLTPAASPAPVQGGPSPAVPQPDDRLIALVTELSDHLIATSLPDRYAHMPRTWIGPRASAEADRPWPPCVLGYDLYTGRTGPALALAAAGRLLDDNRYRDLSAQIFSTTAEILATQSFEIRNIQRVGFGGYTGMAGILFALSTAGKLLGEDSWTQAAQGAVPLIVDQVRSLPPGQLPLDVISGLAGALSCMTAIGGPHADAAITPLASLLVDALQGDGSDDGLRSALAQSGFAHGISGILHALSRAHPHLPPGRQPLVESTLADMVGRLHDFYDPGEGNWHSSLDRPGSFSTGWCHGATGIALALSAYGTVSGDDEVVRLRDKAIDNMLRHGFGRNLTWCHGDLGNHDALTTLADCGGTSLRAEIAEIEQRWLQPETFARKLGDTRSRYAHTNSLLVGTAGIVLHLVNRLDPTSRVSPTTFVASEDR